MSKKKTSANLGKVKKKSDEMCKNYTEIYENFVKKAQKRAEKF